MPWVRQLPSGLWAATVYTPAGRIVESHKLKGVVDKWADDLESDIRRGVFLDPRLAKKPLREVWDTYEPARRLEKASRARDMSHWRCHVEPRWGGAAVGAILKPDVQAWVNEMEQAHRDDCDGRRCSGCRYGGWTIIAALNVLKAGLELAVDAGLIRANPARRVRPPVPPAHEDRVVDADEERLILSRCDDLLPGRRDARPFIEGLFETGARWEELAAVKKEAVDLRHALVSLGPVMERDGTIREYPKGARTRQHAGFRDAAIGEEYLARLKPLLLATKPGGVVFSASEGGHLLYPTWLDRVWNLVISGMPQRILKHAPAGAYDADAFGCWLDQQKAWLGFEADRGLALAAGIRPSMVSSWRANRFGPSQATAEKLAVGLGVAAEEVFRAAGLLVEAVDGAGLDEPLPTPHDCRHTFGTRLADAGVELHDRMALMGHKDVRSGQRYTHSGATRFDKAREAMRQARR